MNAATLEPIACANEVDVIRQLLVETPPETLKPLVRHILADLTGHDPRPEVVDMYLTAAKEWILKVHAIVVSGTLQ